MGKNQQYKAMQRSKVGSASGGPEEIEDGMNGMLLVWLVLILLIQLHGKNIKRNKRMINMKKDKPNMEDELKKGELEADKDKMMREYRAQLDAERAHKLALGRNYSSSKLHSRKEKREKNLKKQSSKKRKHRRKSSDSSSSTSSSDSSSSEDEREARRSRSRSKSRSKKPRKDRKRRYRAKHSSSSGEDSDGPLPLSKFFGTVKT